MALRVATMPRRAAHRLRRPQLNDAMWLAPVAVYLTLKYLPRLAIIDVPTLIAMIVGLGIVVLVARRPAPGLLLFGLLLPFNLVFFAQLYAWGVPAQLIKPLLWWKELILVGVVVAGIQGFIRSGRKPDRLDVVALSFVSLVGIYALFPRLFSAIAPMDSEVRQQGFRFSALFVVLLLAARYAELPPSFPRAMARMVLIATTAVALIGIFEFFFSVRWNDYLVNTAQVPRFWILVLEVPRETLRSVQDFRVGSTVGAGHWFRVGTVFADPLGTGFYLVPGFAIAVERTVRGGVRTATLACIAIGGALMLTQTRAAIIGGLLVCVFAFRPAPGRQADRRVRFAFILAALMIFAAPAAAGSGFAERAGAVTGDDDSSIEGHWNSFHYGVDTLIAYPLGQGLGTSAGVGQRFAGNTKTSENYYLQTGNEMGVVTLLAFVGTTLLMLGGLRRATQSSEDEVSAAYWGAGVGLAVGAFFLHTWVVLPVAWTFWAGAGAVMGSAERLERAREPVAAAPYG